MNISKLNKVRLLVGSSLAVLSISAAAAAQNADLALPEQPLSESLRSVAQKTGENILFTPESVAGLRGRALSGQMSAAQAVNMLTSGTNLEVVADGRDGLIVRRPSHIVTEVARDPAPAAPAQPEQIVVTGSRVIVNGNASPTPLTVVSTAQLAATTPSNVPDALNKLPEFSGSSSQRTTGNPSANTTGNFLNLRGFGSQRTLILLDGNRVPATAANGTVDINTLPQMLMSRVDVVTGGASAVYGSDAVTGVVNFILDKKFDGLKITAQGGVSSEGDDASYKFGIAGGTDLLGGRGHAEFSYEHYNSDGIPSMSDRPLGHLVYSEPGSGTAASPYHLVPNSRLESYTPGGYITSSNPALGDHFFQSNGVLVPFTHGLPTGTALDEEGGDGGYAGEGVPGAGANPWLLASLRTDQLFGRFDYDFSDTVHAYVQASAAQAYNFNVFFTQWFSANILSGNPYLPASVQAQMAPGETFSISKTIQDAPGYSSRGLTGNVDGTLGFSGTLGHFDWDLHYTHGESRLHEADPNNLNQQRLTASLDSVRNSSGQIVCRVSTTAYANLYPGCIPYDPFGPTAETAGAVQYVDDYTDFVETNKMDNVAGGISGALFNGWAGPIRGALSGEYRKMALTTTSNFPPTAKVDCSTLNAATCSPSAQYWTSNVVGPMSASESVWETAVETDIPLLVDVPFVEALSLNAAGRYTQYSVSGPATTWKVGLVWNVNDDIMLRGTVSRDIRAPTLYDLFSPVTSGLSGYSDLLTKTGGNLQAISQGNPDLKPEVAHTTTMGIVYKPSYIEGLSLSVDYYMITIQNAITSVGGSSPTIQNQCIASGGTSPYCALYVRPFPITNTTPANFPTAVLSESLNVAKASTHGIDAEADYAFDLADIQEGWPGSLNLRLLGAYQPALLSQTMPGAIVTNGAGAAGLAAGRISLNVGYTAGPYSINLQERYLSSERQSSNPTLVYLTPDIPSISYTDLSLSYRFKLRAGDADDAAETFLSVQNLFDQQPHIYSNGGTGSQGFGYPTPNDEDVVGRYFTLGVRYHL